MVFSRAGKNRCVGLLTETQAMRLLTKTNPTRQAFTLVELIVVIAIILTLAALLLSAIFKALIFAVELST